MVIKRTNQLTGPQIWLAQGVTQTSYFFSHYKPSHYFLATLIRGKINNINISMCPILVFQWHSSMQHFIYAWILCPWHIFIFLWDKRLYLSRVKGIFLFKLDQPAVSEQCKWVLPIHSSVICHKSQGLHEDFEMLIRLSVVTSLCTFKKYNWSNFYVRLEVVKVASLPNCQRCQS